MIYFLDGNQEVIKIVRSSAVISTIQTQELPEDNSLLRDYLNVRLKNDERLFNAQYMAVKSYGGNRNAFDLYRIASEIVPDNATEFMGVQVAPYELEGVVIEDLRPQDRPLNQTMSQVLEGSDWRLGYAADNLPAITTTFYYVSAKDALKSIQELANVEMLFKVEISGNKITDKWVEVYHQLGNRTMKRFNYGTNALSVVRESSHDELYTALIGRGKGEEVGETESGDATYGRKINFAEVEWKKSAGKPVDKPKGQKYIELPSATAEYGIKLLDGRKVPRVGLVEFSETEDPEILIQETYQELLVRARPKVLFKASVINTGDMLIGDTVTIHRHDLDFHYQARVRKVVRDRKNNNKTQVEIGDVVHTASTKRQGQINSALNNVASDLENVRGEITEARQSADGKNTNFYGNVEPERKKVGDTWFRDHPSLTGESQILVWNGEAWELIMDTSNTTKNAEDVLEAKGIAEIARDNALNIATDLLEGTSFYKHTQDIGLASKNSDGTINSIINLGSDGTAYIGGRNIVLDGNTIVDGTFTITDKMIAPNAEIDGAKIQDATIGSAKIANLDVGKISGNTANFVRASFNAIGTSTQIEAGNINVIGSNQWRKNILTGSGIELFDGQGAIRLSGVMGYFKSQISTATADEYVMVRNDERHAIGVGVRDSHDFIIGSAAGRSNPNHFEPAFEVEGRSGKIRIHSKLYPQNSTAGTSFITQDGQSVNYQFGNTFEYGTGGIHMTTNAGTFLKTDRGWERYQMYDRGPIGFEGNAQVRGYANDGALSLAGGGKVSFYTNRNVASELKMELGGNLDMFTGINMQGHALTNESDRRLKKNIRPAQIDSLGIVMGLSISNFEWIEEGKPKGVQLGVIAQDTPDLAVYDEESGFYSIDSSKQLMITTHAVQQLAKRVEELEELLNERTT